MGNAYEFELWSHVSDIENHLAKRCLKWQTPLDVLPVKLLTSVFSVTDGMHRCGTKRKPQPQVKQNYFLDITWALPGMWEKLCVQRF